MDPDVSPARPGAFSGGHPPPPPPHPMAAPGARESASAPPAPSSLAFRRFVARKIDYVLWSWGLILLALAGDDAWLDRLAGFSTAGSAMLVAFSWVFLEVGFLVSAGTTPGKWLLGMALQRPDRGLPTPGAAIRRSLGVWALGVGLGLPVLSLFTTLNGYVRLQRGASLFWDRAGLELICRPIGTLRFAAVTALALALGASAYLPTDWLVSGGVDYRAEARAELSDFLEDAREAAVKQGIHLAPVSAPVLDEGVEGGVYEFDVAVGAPGHYAVVGACDGDCGNLDLVVRSESGDFLGEDALPDAYPMVGFTTEEPFRAKVAVSVEHCGTEPCAFAYQLVEASESVVYLWGPGEGTCFAVRPDGVVLTAHHVVDGSRTVQVALAGEEMHPARVLATDEERDLAVLQLPVPTPDYLDLAAPDALRLGQRIFTMGFPVRDMLGSEPKFSDGTVASVRGLSDAAGFFQMSVPIQPGSSGGPVLDEEGRVVGVVNSSAAVERFLDETGTLPQGVNWATRGEAARALFEAGPPRPPATGRDAAIERVRRALCRVEVR